MPYHKTLFPAERLLRLASRFQTPTYVYSEQRIRENTANLKQLFNDLPVEWLYAVKANDNPHLLRIIQDCGFGFDVVSIEETLLAEEVIARTKPDSPTTILYTENNMSDEEMEIALKQKNVILNIGSLSRLKAVAESGRVDRCCIRIKPDVGDGHHSKVITGQKDSKFGIRMDHVTEAVSIAREHGMKIEGIHAHIGSGIQRPENLKEAMEVLLEVADDVPDLKFVNFGGGIPIPYRPNEEVFNLQVFETLATPVMRRFLKNHPEITFLFEPGRFVVGDAGVFLASVTDVKNQGEITFVGTDTGFNHLLRPILYEAYHHPVNLTASENLDERGDELHPYRIVGNICETGDTLVEQAYLPDTRIGDLIAFCDAGAYGMTMASHYNRRRLPAEVLLHPDGTHSNIRHRESPNEVIEQLLKRTHF